MQPKSVLKALTIIHATMCLILVVFSAFAYTLNGEFLSTTDYGNIFVYIVPILAMAGYFGSQFIFQNLIKKLKKEEPLTKKLQQYQIASIFKFALIEGPAFLALVIYYLDGNALYLVIGISLTVYLFFQRPTLEKAKNELPLDIEEKKKFNKS